MGEKPKTIEEVEKLVESGDMSVWIQEERENKIILLVCDYRRSYEEDELYELAFDGGEIEQN